MASQSPEGKEREVCRRAFPAPPSLRLFWCLFFAVMATDSKASRELCGGPRILALESASLRVSADLILSPAGSCDLRIVWRLLKDAAVSLHLCVRTLSEGISAPDCTHLTVTPSTGGRTEKNTRKLAAFWLESPDCVLTLRVRCVDSIAPAQGAQCCVLASEIPSTLFSPDFSFLLLR